METHSADVHTWKGNSAREKPCSRDPDPFHWEGLCHGETGSDSKSRIYDAITIVLMSNLNELIQHTRRSFPPVCWEP